MAGDSVEPARAATSRGMPGEPRPLPRTRLLWVIVGLLAAALAVAAVAQRLERAHLVQQTADLQVQVQAARAAGDAARTQAELAARHAEALEARIAAIEALGAAAASAGAGVDTGRGRDEAALLEVERLLSFAQQELQLGGSTASALTALQSADGRLARLQRPQLLQLRRALARDLERVRALPVVDIAGTSIRLDQLAQAADGWTLLADPAQRLPPGRSAGTRPIGPDGKAPDPKGSESRSADAKPLEPKPADPRAAEPKAVEPKGSEPKSAAAKGAPARPNADSTARAPQGPMSMVSITAEAWHGLRSWMAAEFGDLVRVREVSTPDALLLDPAQAALVRERLKLRLLTARHALLTRNERQFRPEIVEVQAIVERYFDPKQPAVIAAGAELKALLAMPLAFEPPASLDSVAALRALAPLPVAPGPPAAAVPAAPAPAARP
jgi:uroporphyrin-3 C-methyltransferase/uroporphyrinogen III methyltransferase/synthase